MKHLMTLLGLAVSIAVGAQTDCGLQYDGNGDGAVDALDLLGLLSEYSDICEPAFACGDSVLFDGHSYETVPIGDQCWFKENLRTEHYANGDEIPGNLSDSEWTSTSSGAQAVYGNNDVNLEAYGRLYNWYAVDDSRGLCPSGWHVPTDGEWTELTDNLGGSSVAGAAMKSSPSDTPSWDGSNTSGFWALPGGLRYEYFGFFSNVGNGGYWWSASPYGSSGAWFRSLYSANSYVDRGSYNRRIGYSVRCVRDE